MRARNGYLQVRRGSLDCDERWSRVMDTARRCIRSSPRPPVGAGAGTARLVHTAALPEETAILDDSDLRSFGHPLFGRQFVAHDPGVVVLGHRGSLSISCHDLGAVLHADA